MRNKEKPIFNLYNSKMILFYIGVAVIGLFAIIFFISAIVSGKANYLSFFFNNIRNNLLLTIMTGVHVALLGFGILLVMVSIYNMTPKIKCFSDRFEINQIFQYKKTIYFKDIKGIDVKIHFLKSKNIFTNSEKECRVLFKNTVFNFYLAYNTKGYFDDIEIKLNDNPIFSRKCFVEKWIVEEIINIIKKNYNIKTPFLPEETK